MEVKRDVSLHVFQGKHECLCRREERPMLFNSVQYILFLPLCVVLYYLVPQRWRNLFLLVASYYFYMCWVPQYALLMAVSTLTTWLCGFFVDGAKRGFWRKAALVANIVVNLGILFLFKYYNFFISLITRSLAVLGFSAAFPSSSLLLPVGISFYTFQALGYSIDVYRGDICHERNLINYAVFVSFFPQLVAGPIERSRNLLPQFRETHRFDPAQASQGLRLILLGMFKKVAIADMAAMYVDAVFEDLYRFSGPTVAVAVFLFSIQIYCDFSGYSDVARGSAQIFGFRLMENFDAPYFSTSITEFWSRWHISLSTWFRDYLYIPLGGNRKGFTCKLVNLMVIFLVSGLWHGAALSFVVWGALHGLYRVAEEAWRKCVKPLEFRYSWCVKVQTVVKTIWCFALVSVAWIFFRADSVLSGFLCVRRALSTIMVLSTAPKIFLSEIIGIMVDKFFYAKAFLMFLCFIFVLGILILFVNDGSKKSKKMERGLHILLRSQVRWVVYWTGAVLIIICFMIQHAIFGQTGQFIYFQF
jgi:D-alanyl-lipoteichoic acid acyltransferase DltB (MBOAT superfamily)